VIVTERPGFGASTGHDGGTFLDHADDLAALLDELGIERLPVLGLSGAAPYVLAFAARHGNRVEATTIVVGSAPKEGREASFLIGLNAQTHRLATAGDREGMTRLLTTVRDSLLADPLASFRELMKTAPPADQEIMRQRSWQEMLTRGLTEARCPRLGRRVDAPR
jgi:pimeloyl-ACP methyl ester carboxylesterase